MADPDPAVPTPPDPPLGPSQSSLDEVGPVRGGRAGIPDVATPRGCPYLLAEGGGWRLDMPLRAHRCAAVSPPAALALEKQARLCLTAAHVDCATYLASMAARGSRLATPGPVRTTRWGLARTTTVIEDAGGLRARVLAVVLDRRRWPAIPAVILVTTLVVLAFSGLRGGGASPIATASPSRAGTTSAPNLVPTEAPIATDAASSAPSQASTAAPTPTATKAPTTTTGPTQTFRTYRVLSGDTLSGIAGQFGTTSRAIADLNGFSVSTTLHIGQILKIPNAAP